MSVRILQTGITLLQDSGRPGFENVGVPASGAFDNINYRLVAELLKEDNPTVFEILHGVFKIIAENKDLVATVVGPADVKSSTAGGPHEMVFLVLAGETLQVTPKGNGTVYVGVSGLKTETVLGSSSADTMSGLGYKPVQAGDIFETPPITAATEELVGRFIHQPPSHGSSIIRYMAGPTKVSANLLRGPWSPTMVARSGIRLNGESAEELATSGGSMQSLPVIPGTIQLPPNGQPIILGPDSGVTGGYPVAGVVITADLHLLANLTAGTTVTLREVGENEAVEAYETQQRMLASAIVDSGHLGGF